MQKKYKVGVIFGCWDLLHAGHMVFINGAKEVCEKLIVGLHVNPSIERDSKNVPIQSLFERYLQLDMLLRDTDQIVPYETESDIHNIINCYEINVRIIGSDYDGVNFTAKELLPTVYLPRDHTFSSSELRNRIVMTGYDRI
jgi:glycerol-3-phosphate cytidylyltransferase